MTTEKAPGDNPNGGDKDEKRAARVLHDLKNELSKRSAFVEHCFRTNALPAPAGSTRESLAKVRNQRQWRTKIRNSLRAFAPSLSVSGDPCSAVKHANRTHFIGASSKDRAPDGEVEPSWGSGPAAGTAWVVRQADELVALFTRQQATYLLLRICHEQLIARSAAGGKLPRSWKEMMHDVDAVCDRWLNELPGEILVFYDAAILELLAARHLVGDMSVLSYDLTLASIRPSPTNQDKVSARRKLERLIGSLAHSASDQTSPYWYLLRPDSILRAVEKGVLSAWWDIVGFCVAVFEGATLEEAAAMANEEKEKEREKSQAETEGSGGDACEGATTRHYAPPPEEPTGRADWFYDPDRLRAIIGAARYALRNETAPFDKREHTPEADRASVRTLQRALELFRSATEPNEDDGSSDFEVKRPTPPDLLATFRHRKAIEDVWWRTFDFLGTGESRKLRPSDELRAWCGRRPFSDKTICKLLSPDKRGPKPTVIVFGAGVAGLTAAHELALRNFEVRVVESAPAVGPGDAANGGSEEPTTQVGGVARTQWSRPSPRRQNDHESDRVPGEHGYRLFPSFYRHVFDTMKRTPLSVRIPGIRSTAFDQLEPTFHQVFATRKSFVPLSRERPRSLEAFRRAYMALIGGLGFSRRDLSRFFFKLLRYLMTSSARRAKEYEGVSLFEFFGAHEKGLYSKAMVDAMRAAPQALVAMDAERCDARTQGNVYLQLLLDQVLGSQYTDSVLSGPTSTTWFAPWRNHLQQNLEVKFYRGELLSIREKKKEKGRPEREFEVIVAPLDGEPPLTADYYVVALDPVAAERVTRWWDSATCNAPHDGVPRELRGFASYVDQWLSGPLDRYTVTITYRNPTLPQRAEVKLRRLLRLVGAAERDPSLAQREQSVFRAVAHFTGALVHEPEGVPEIGLHLWLRDKIGPREARVLERVIRRWVGRAEDVRLISEEPQRFEGAIRVRTPRLPEHQYGETPGDRFQTFTGIQFYLEQDFKLVRGHVFFPDTEWGLSAISQAQVWFDNKIDVKDKEGKPVHLRGVLSVDVGNCRKRSSYSGKSLMESSPDEIANEVWRQIEDSLRTTRGGAAPVTNLPLPKWKYYHPDSNLEFADNALLANRSPFLINNVGDWENRPRCMPWVPGRGKLGDGARTDGTGLWQAPHGGYRVHDDKVVFCGSYMRTFTRMNTMEAANESARHAVNAILDHLASTESAKYLAKTGITGDYCDIWDLEEHELDDLAFFKRVDEMLLKAGKPHIADILQFDKLADLQYPEPTPGQSLLAALGATFQKDWGVEPNEVAGSVNGLLEMIRGMSKDLGGSGGGTGSIPGIGGVPGIGAIPGIGSVPGIGDLGKLLSILGVGKGGKGGEGA